MSYDEVERSNYGSKPVALYEFAIGSKTWRYCSGETPIVAGGNPYEAIAISDEGITLSGDAANDDLSISLPSNTEFLSIFRGQGLSQAIWVTLRRFQIVEGETEAPVIWIGTLSSLKQQSATQSKITCHVLTASFNRRGLRMSWSRRCPFSLYDRNCRVDKTLFGISLQPESLGGNTVQSDALAAFPNGYFSFGFFEWEILPGVIERRAIERHVGASFTILGTSNGLKTGDWINVFPGCNLTTTTCEQKFNNLSNYGGIPHLPGKSPFDGHPVF